MSIDQQCDTPRSLPIKPLATLAGHQLPDKPAGRWTGPGTALTVDARLDRLDIQDLWDQEVRFAEALGVHKRTLRRWMNDGVPIPRADELACQLGLHPLIVWPDLWEAAEDARGLRLGPDWPEPDELDEYLAGLSYRLIDGEWVAR